jgi:hypothetical protein
MGFNSGLKGLISILTLIINQNIVTSYQLGKQFGIPKCIGNK